MPGLFMDMGMGTRAAPQARYGNAPAPSSATEAAYGVGSAPPQSFSGLSPAGPVGAAFWFGVGGLVFLVVIYRSLPG